MLGNQYIGAARILEKANLVVGESSLFGIRTFIHWVVLLFKYSCKAASPTRRVQIPVKELLAISVVIPSFNRPQLTLRAVKSVLDQTWTDFEIVVFDDGSRCDQVFPIEQIADHRVRLIRHRTNLGVSAARNTGVNESRYPLVALLDSDDRIRRQIPVHCGADLEDTFFTSLKALARIGRPESV